jgi:hypothetical protein
VTSSCIVPGETGEPRGPPWSAARVALSRPTRYHLLIQGHLRVLGDERDPICPLTVVERSHKKRAIGRQLGQCLVTVRAVSGEAPAPMAVSVAVVTMCFPPPSSILTREALTCRVDGIRVWMAVTLGKAPIYRGEGPTEGAWTLGRFYLEFELQINEAHSDFAKGIS